MKQTEVVVLDYDVYWMLYFEEIKNRIQPCLEDFKVDIQHVGSTSVPGLAAKPIIDIDVITKEKDQIPMLIKAIEIIGYEHLGDLGIKGREAFRIIKNDDNLFRHNLYMGHIDSPSIQNHLKLRDYLIANKEIAQKYGDLKKELAKKYPNNPALYTEKKSDFILEILSGLGFDNDLLHDIRDQNKA